jgi:hypothetical protein
VCFKILYFASPDCSGFAFVILGDISLVQIIINSNLFQAKNIESYNFWSNPTFAIRTVKQSFSGINRLETIDFTGVDFQNRL